MNDKEITNSELLESINKGFSRIEEKMATKTDLAKVQLDVSILKTDVSDLKTDVSGLKTDQKSFRTETRERFDKVDVRLNEIDENIDGIVKDYHPHIIALEEKVFGSSTLAES